MSLTLQCSKHPNYDGSFDPATVCGVCQDINDIYDQCNTPSGAQLIIVTPETGRMSIKKKK